MDGWMEGGESVSEERDAMRHVVLCRVVTLCDALCCVVL